MTVVQRIAVFAAVLVAVFAIAFWVGGTFGPNPDLVVPHPDTTVEHQSTHGGAG